MLTHLISKLKHEQDAVLDRHLLSVGKHRLLAEISRRQNAYDAAKLRTSEYVRLATMRLVRKFVPGSRTLLALALIVLIMTSTGFIAQAAIPGDVLYPAKLLYEKAEIVLAVSAASEGQVHIRHANNRLRELAIVTQKKSNNRNQNISQLVRRLEKDITAAGQSLKVAKEGNKNASPAVILLAKNLNDKASEAAKVLEENRKVLTASVTAAIPEMNPDDLPLLAVGGSAATSTEENNATSSAETIAADDSPEVVAETARVINEVRQVNEYISYEAIAAMIEMVERRYANNRQEATAALAARIQELRIQWHSVGLDAITPRITDNFLLHKKELLSLNSGVTSLLNEAEDAKNLDNLSRGLQKALEAKDAIAKVVALLTEVQNGGGVVDATVSKPSKGKTPVPLPKDLNDVTIQSVPGATSTEDGTGNQ